MSARLPSNPQMVGMVTLSADIKMMGLIPKGLVCGLTVHWREVIIIQNLQPKYGDQ